MRSVASVAVPSDADSSPDAMRSSVLLPQPDGPTTVTNSPRLTVKSTPCSATVPLGKVMATLEKSSSVLVVTGGALVSMSVMRGHLVSRWVKLFTVCSSGCFKEEWGGGGRCEERSGDGVPDLTVCDQPTGVDHLGRLPGGLLRHGRAGEEHGGAHGAEAKELNFMMRTPGQ